MYGLAHDLRDSLRAIGKNPGFSAVVIVTLALGIGANAAIFTLYDQILLRRLPVERPEELVLLDGPGAFRGRTENEHTFSYPMYVDLRDGNQVFSGVLARYRTPLTLTHGGEAERVTGELVSGDYFQVLGVKPVIGRAFGADDDRLPGAHPVVILGHGYWKRRFGGDPLILDQTIGLNGHPMTVVGIAPPGFHGLGLEGAADIFVPIMMKAQMTPTWDDLDNRQSRWLNVFARLAPGVSPEAAEAAMQPLYRGILENEIALLEGGSERFRESFLTKRLGLLPGAQGMPELRNDAGGVLEVLMAMVGLVLLIACANVAGLLLARAQARQRDVAMRVALGAGRGRIVRQRLIECLLYAAAGGGLGLLLAAWGGELLMRILPLAGTPAISTAPDLRAVLFVAGVAAATVLVFGLVPALQTSRPELTPALREGGGAVGGGVRHARFRRAAVTVQVALSAVLLAAALLFGRTLHNLRSLDPGFEIDHLVTFSLDPSRSGYDAEGARGLYLRLRDELAGLPGVRGVTLAAIPLLDDTEWFSTVWVDGYEATEEEEDLNPQVNAVGPGYFATLGVPLVGGREFTDADGPGAPRVAVINQTMARYFFGESNPIGRRFGFGRDEATAVEIVGVARDAKSTGLRGEIPRALWIPSSQPFLDFGAMTFYVRHDPAAGDVPAALREAARRIDPAIPLFDLKTMTAQASESLFLERLAALLATLFGVLATLLAAIGLYGMMSYAVVRRTREFGIRIALGALKPRIVWSVLREVALLVALGLALGLPAAYGLARLAEALLYGLSPADPVALAGACGLLVLVAIAAGSMPARRATQVDPMRALRFE
jgi:predicted permease